MARPFLPNFREKLKIGRKESPIQAPHSDYRMISQSVGVAYGSEHRRQPSHNHFGVKSQGQINSLVADRAFIADFNPQGIKDDDRINRIKRAVLSVSDFIYDSICHRGKQILGDFYAADFLKVPLCTVNISITGNSQPIQPELDQTRIRLDLSQPLDFRYL